MAKLDSNVAIHDPNHRRQQQIDAGIIPDYQKHKDDTAGKWWTRHCDPDAFPDQESYNRAVAEYEGKATTIWVDQGNQPPAPSVSGATLAKAAWQATTIPNPTIDTNHLARDLEYLGIEECQKGLAPAPLFSTVVQPTLEGLPPFPFPSPTALHTQQLTDPLEHFLVLQHPMWLTFLLQRFKLSPQNRERNKVPTPMPYSNLAQIT